MCYTTGKLRVPIERNDELMSIMEKWKVNKKNYLNKMMDASKLAIREIPNGIENYVMDSESIHDVYTWNQSLYDQLEQQFQDVGNFYCYDSHMHFQSQLHTVEFTINDYVFIFFIQINADRSIAEVVHFYQKDEPEISRDLSTLSLETKTDLYEKFLLFTQCVYDLPQYRYRYLTDFYTISSSTLENYMHTATK